MGTRQVASDKCKPGARGKASAISALFKSAHPSKGHVWLMNHPSCFHPEKCSSLWVFNAIKKDQLVVMTSDDKKGSTKAKHDKDLRLSNIIFLLNLATIARNQATKSRSAYLGRQSDRYYGSEIEIIDLVKNGRLWVNYDRKSFKRSEIFSLLILDLAAIISGAVLGIFATFTLGDVVFQMGCGRASLCYSSSCFKNDFQNNCSQFPNGICKNESLGVAT